MNSEWIVTINHWSSVWAEGTWRACMQGSLAILIVWAACRLFPRLPTQVRCWLWRLAYAKLLIALLGHPDRYPASACSGCSQSRYRSGQSTEQKWSDPSSDIRTCSDTGTCYQETAGSESNTTETLSFHHSDGPLADRSCRMHRSHVARMVGHAALYSTTTEPRDPY